MGATAEIGQLPATPPQFIALLEQPNMSRWVKEKKPSPATWQEDVVAATSSITLNLPEVSSGASTNAMVVQVKSVQVKSKQSPTKQSEYLAVKSKQSPVEYSEEQLRSTVQYSESIVLGEHCTGGGLAGQWESSFQSATGLPEANGKMGFENDPAIPPDAPEAPSRRIPVTVPSASVIGCRHSAPAVHKDQSPPSVSGNHHTSTPRDTSACVGTPSIGCAQTRTPMLPFPDLDTSTPMLRFPDLGMTGSSTCDASSSSAASSSPPEDTSQVTVVPSPSEAPVVVPRSQLLQGSSPLKPPYSGSLQSTSQLQTPPTNQSTNQLQTPPTNQSTSQLQTLSTNQSTNQLQTPTTNSSFTTEQSTIVNTPGTPVAPTPLDAPTIVCGLKQMGASGNRLGSPFKPPRFGSSNSSSGPFSLSNSARSDGPPLVFSPGQSENSRDFQLSVPEACGTPPRRRSFSTLAPLSWDRLGTAGGAEKSAAKGSRVSSVEGNTREPRASALEGAARNYNGSSVEGSTRDSRDSSLTEGVIRNDRVVSTDGDTRDSRASSLEGATRNRRIVSTTEGITRVALGEGGSGPGGGGSGRMVSGSGIPHSGGIPQSSGIAQSGGSQNRLGTPNGFGSGTLTPQGGQFLPPQGAMSPRNGQFLPPASGTMSPRNGPFRGPASGTLTPRGSGSFRGPSSGIMTPRGGSCRGLTPRQPPLRLGPLVTALAENDKVGIREAACNVRVCLKGCKENKTRLIQAGGVQSLVLLAQSGDPETVEHGVTAIFNICREEQAAEEIAAAGGLEALVSALIKGRNTARENAAATIFCLAGWEEYRVKFCQLGAVPPLVKLLDTGNVRGQKDAALALFNLMKDVSTVEALVDAGGVPVLLSLLVGSEAGLEDKVMAVLAIVSKNETGRRAILDEEGLLPLIDVLELASQRAREDAVTVLYYICSKNKDALAFVAKEGIITSLHRVAQSESERVRVKASTLLQLLRNQYKPE